MPAFVRVVVDAAMLQEAVVPNDERVGFPIDSALILDAIRQRRELFQQPAAILIAPAFEAFEIRLADIQTRSARLWMTPSGWIEGFQLILGKAMALAQAQALVRIELGIFRPDVLS